MAREKLLERSTSGGNTRRPTDKVTQKTSGSSARITEGTAHITGASAEEAASDVEDKHLLVGVKVPDPVFFCSIGE